MRNFQGNVFFMNKNILGYFQIWISVPLRIKSFAISDPDAQKYFFKVMILEFSCDFLIKTSVSLDISLEN